MRHSPLWRIGVFIDMRLGVVWTLRDGLVIRGREYATHEAVGLPE